jgi:protein-tyrosine phosphatase
MILEAQSVGVKSIVLTPHYHKGIFDSDKIQDNFNELKIRTRDFGVELFLGYEVFLVTSLSEVIQQKKKFTLNNSDYLLFELPFEIMPVELYKTILNLQEEKIIPIIAHPERNQYFVKAVEKFVDLSEAGCLVQLDAGSIAGVYGSRVRNFTKKLIKWNMVQFIASDAHKPGDYLNLYAKAYDQVINWVGKENADELFFHNQNFILKHSIVL